MKWFLWVWPGEDCLEEEEDDLVLFQRRGIQDRHREIFDLLKQILLHGILSQEIPSLCVPPDLGQLGELQGVPVQCLLHFCLQLLPLAVELL